MARAMSRKQQKAMFAKSSVPLPKPIRYKRTLDKPNKKVYQAGDERVTIIDDNRGVKPVTLFYERNEDPRLIEEFRTRGEAFKRFKEIKERQKRGL